MVKVYWRPAYAGVLLLQLLLITDLTMVGLAKRGGGGVGGMGRGAKTGSVGRTSNTGRGSQSQPTYNRPSSGGTGVGTGYGVGSYATNRKPSSGGGSWKTHAAAGVAGAVIGAAVSHQLTKSYYKHSYGGRDYYYGDRYYRPSSNYAKRCTYPMEDELKYDDGYRVKDVVFECGRYEHCCGMECCSDSGGLPWWGIILIILALILLIASCVYLCAKFRKSSSTTQYSSKGNAEASVPLQGNTSQPGDYYPAGPTFPAYPPAPDQPPSYPQAYGGYPPPAAPGYGFNVQPAYPKQY